MKYLPHYPGPRPTDIPEAFGFRAPYHCERCGPLASEPETVQTQRRTNDQDAVNEYECPNCGSFEVREVGDLEHIPFRAIRRRRIHSNHSMRIAA